jgi:hypothetical protein
LVAQPFFKQFVKIKIVLDKEIDIAGGKLHNTFIHEI